MRSPYANSLRSTSLTIPCVRYSLCTYLSIPCIDSRYIFIAFIVELCSILNCRWPNLAHIHIWAFCRNDRILCNFSPSSLMVNGIKAGIVPKTFVWEKDRAFLRDRHQKGSFCSLVLHYTSCNSVTNLPQFTSLVFQPSLHLLDPKFIWGFPYPEETPRFQLEWSASWRTNGLVVSLTPFLWSPIDNLHPLLLRSVLGHLAIYFPSFLPLP